MTKTTPALGAALTAVVLTAAGCSNSTGSQSATTASRTGSPSSSTSAAVTDHNQADATFAQQMIVHHQQAVQMSDMLLAKAGIDPRVVNLANQIKAAQGPEIQTMQGWLTKWGVPAPPGNPPSGMPGMMSEQDMAALQSAQGVQASKTFLNQMISHHHGAIAMAQTELTSGQNSDAIALAKSISTSQQQEITTMHNILSSL
jgi:uncharacterized protein (DUF305 family)